MSPVPKEDYKDAFLILEASESGRPAEFVAQFVASYFVSSVMTISEKIEFISQFLDRVSVLLVDEVQIWPTLLPGGWPPDAPSFSLIEGDAGGKEAVLSHFSNLNQDDAEAVAQEIFAMPNIGKPQEPSPVEQDVAIDLLRKAFSSGQLRGTEIGDKIAHFIAKGPTMDDVKRLAEQREFPQHIVLTYRLKIHLRDDTVYFVPNGATFFLDEFGVYWVKFVPSNGHDHGQEHMVAVRNVHHFVRDE